MADAAPSQQPEGIEVPSELQDNNNESQTNNDESKDGDAEEESLPAARKKWMILLLVSIVAALGAGIGIGVAVRDTNSSSSSALQQEPTLAPLAPTESPTTSSPSTRNPTTTTPSTLSNNPTSTPTKPGFTEDPFNPPFMPDEPNRWKTPHNSSGLQLQLINTLDDTWQDLFALVVREWDQGQPDALTLSSTRAPIDPDCRPEPGVAKICNANYGDTRWRGNTQLQLEDGFIVASTVRLNEFYGGVQRQFTLCHQLGHVWGLPNADEDFHNADLGNCMDHTITPANNQSPDASNFQLLADIYGTVESRVRRLTRQSYPNKSVQRLQFVTPV